MFIQFTIKGNQEDPRGNPVPYHRTTQKAKWSDEAKRYERWKKFVVDALMIRLSENKEIWDVFAKQWMAGKKPIIPSSKKQRCDIVIFWKNKAHGDPDNILKGINDALFQNDKNVACSVDFSEDIVSTPMLEVTLDI